MGHGLGPNQTTPSTSAQAVPAPSLFDRKSGRFHRRQSCLSIDQPKDRGRKLAPVQILDVRSKSNGLRMQSKERIWARHWSASPPLWRVCTTGGGLGIVFAIVGAGLLLVSAAGFYKIKAV